MLAIDEVVHADDAISDHSCNNGASQGHHAPSLIVWQNKAKELYFTIILGDIQHLHCIFQRSLL